jgi:Fic family protein
LGDDLDGRVEHEVVEGALHIHANLIKIHPFRDGNGRVGRLALSYWLRRKRLPPVFFENAKEDYLRAMNHMYLHGDTGPLLHLALSLYRKQL